MKKLIAATLVWMLTALAAAQTPAGAVTVVRPDGQSKLFTAQALSALPRESVSATDHDKTVAFSGTDLREVLRAAGVEPPDHVHGDLMRRVILVQGADGYAVVFAFAELDPSLGARVVHLVDRVEDQALPAKDGPWRLVVPKDARGGRWVRQVKRISVVDLP
jgi:DMSO/TMAO reductase YedYZ molybdopterin-dependent catalytic subunit